LIVFPQGNEEGLRSTLEALVQQDYPSWRFELIVPDDGSIDFDHLDFSSSPIRLIPCLGCDLQSQREVGIQSARFPLVGFLDAGETPRFDWLAKMSEAFVDPIVQAAKGRFATTQTDAFSKTFQVQYDRNCHRTLKDSRFSLLDGHPTIYKKEVLSDSFGQRQREGFEDVVWSSQVLDSGGRIDFRDLAVVYRSWPGCPGGLWRCCLRPAFWKAVYENRDLSAVRHGRLPQNRGIFALTVTCLVFGVLGRWNALWTVFSVACLVGLVHVLSEESRNLTERSFLLRREVPLYLLSMKVVEGLARVLGFLHCQCAILSEPVRAFFQRTFAFIAASFHELSRRLR